MDNNTKNKIINEFVVNIQNNINNISENLRNDFIEYNVNILKQKIDYDYNVENLLNYFFEIKKIAGDYSLNKIHKLKYFNNNCDIVLIAQYYNTTDEQRHKENAVSLINNILNPQITKIHLLNEEIYNLDFIFKQVGEQYRNKVKQYVIEKRMTYNDAMAYSNKFCKNSIIIIANLDIFFNDDLNKLQSYDFTNLFLSLSRYEMLHDYEFGGNNQVAKFIHNGTLGNPCIDSHDAWMFKTPIQMTHDSKIMLGSLGCDTIINYVYGVTMNYTVVNPIDSIMTIHYHRERERDYRTENGVRSHSGMIYNKDNKFKSDDYNHKYVLQKTVVVCNKIESFCTFATKNAYKDLRLLLHSLEIYHKDIPIFIYCDDYIAEKIDENNFDLHITKININNNTETDINSRLYILNETLKKYKNTLFINNNIILLNPLDLLIDKKYNIGLINDYLNENKNIYDFIYINDINNINKINKIKKLNDDSDIYKFGSEYNYYWFDNKLTLIDNNLLVEFKKLKCINTTLYENIYENINKYNFNVNLIKLLDKINHPIIKYIFNMDNFLIKSKNIKLKKNIAFCLTLKNVDIYLPYIINNLEKLAHYIENVFIIFIYDNNDDKSIEILNEYKIKSNNIIILRKIINNDKLRTHRLENARNEYLNIIYNELKNIDYHIVIDSDDINVNEWNIELILKQFENPIWDILSFNRKKYYDIWALLYDNFQYPCWGYGDNCGEVINFIENDISNKLENLDDDLMECYSSFNGFSIYKTEKLKNIRYSGKWIDVKDMIYTLNIENTIKFLQKNINNSIKVYEEGQINNNNTIDKNEICEHIYYNLKAKIEKNLNIYICKHKLDDTNKHKLNENNNNYKNNKKIVSFTQTYGNERYVEILLQKYDKVGQYMRNKCDKIIFSFHNCSLEIIEKSKKYLSDIYDSNKLEFLIYDNIDYLTSIRKTMSYLKSIDVTDILFMNDDEYFLNNDYNLNNLHLLDILFDYYIKNSITWFSLYGQETPKNKKQKQCIVINDELNIYSYSTLEYKKDNSYAWSQTTALYSLNFCIDLYNNKLPDDSWNIEETFSYYFHTHDYERYGCNIELVRAINLNGHNLSELNLYDNLHRFFFNETDTIYSIVNNINSDENKTIENKNKPTIIIPKMPRNDFWHHNNDTFRELLKLWSENKFIDLVEDDVKHVWYNKIGDILLYDRPTLSWLETDTNIKYNKILFGNPIVPDYLKNIATSWIFWGRSPQKLDYYANTPNLSYHERTLESIFIGKIENSVQAQYRLKYPNIENSIQLYIMHRPEESYKYNQDEYLSLLKKSKFGLSLRGFGPKCNREIELMALGTVPIVASDVDMCNYYDPLVENVHYFRFNTVDEIKKIIENCDEDTWNKMSNACITWYNKNCSIKGSFETTKKIIENFESLVNCEQINKKSEVIDNNMLEYVNDISDKIVFSFGKEEVFSRTNLNSYFSVNHIYNCNKQKYNNVDWDNINLFTTIQEKYIAKFENIKVNSEGIMYDNKNIYTLNNKQFIKTLIKQKEVYTFDEKCIVFNCVQKNGLEYDRFLCEIYPRLFHIKLYIENNPNINKSIVLLLYYNDTFIKEFLEILNFRNVAICPYNDDVEYVCNTLYLYTPSIYEYPSKDSIDIIRKSLFNNNVCVPRINILIKSNKNMINNFDNIFDLLKNKYNEYQWIVFDSEDDIFKNVVKTIQIFSQANLIIGSHDCGLANMIFSSSDCKILELHPEDCGNMYYWHLSNILKNDYNILSVKNMSKKEIMVNNDQLDYTVNQLLDDIFSVKNM